MTYHARQLVRQTGIYRCWHCGEPQEYQAGQRFKRCSKKDCPGQGWNLVEEDQED